MENRTILPCKYFEECEGKQYGDHCYTDGICIECPASRPLYSFWETASYYKSKIGKLEEQLQEAENAHTKIQYNNREYTVSELCKRMAELEHLLNQKETNNAECENCYHRKVCINGANYKSVKECKQYKSEAMIAELPFKTGDTVYQLKPAIHPHRATLTTYIRSSKVNSLVVHDNKVAAFFADKGELISIAEFGKSVFLTRDEADGALKERDDDQ